MQFTVQREVFLQALKWVAGVVEKRQSQTIPILANVLIRIQEESSAEDLGAGHDKQYQFILTTTDQEMELIASGKLESVEEGGTTTVPFRKLMDISRSLPEGNLLQVKVDNETSKVSIRAGKSRFSLSTLSAQDFPSMDETKEPIVLRLPVKELQKLIEQTAFAMAEQDVRYYLNGMLLEIQNNALSCVAADGHRLAFCSATIPIALSQPVRAILPRKGVLELSRILADGEGEVILTLGSNHLRARTDKGSLTTKLIEGRYPDYQAIIPKQGNKVVVGNRSLLKEAFQRAATLLMHEKLCGVTLLFRNNFLKILARNQDQDEVEEEVEIEYEGPDLDIAFNVRYLIDFLNVTESEKVKFVLSDMNASTKLEGVRDANADAKENNESLYVVMPMRI